MTAHRTSPRPCWHCFAPNDAATGADHDEAPTDGDVTLCIECGEWGIFEGESVRKPTDDEYVEIVDNPITARMRAAWLHVTEKKQ